MSRPPLLTRRGLRLPVWLRPKAALCLCVFHPFGVKYVVILTRVPPLQFSVAVSVSQKDKSPNMVRAQTTILSLLLFTTLAAGIAADGGNLLVESYGKLLLIGMDGTQRVLVDSMILAALSPDGRNI